MEERVGSSGLSREVERSRHRVAYARGRRRIEREHRIVDGRAMSPAGVTLTGWNHPAFSGQGGTKAACLASLFGFEPVHPTAKVNDDDGPRLLDLPFGRPADVIAGGQEVEARPTRLRLMQDRDFVGWMVVFLRHATTARADSCPLRCSGNLESGLEIMKARGWSVLISYGHSGNAVATG